MDSSPESPRRMLSTICGSRPPSATIEIVDACRTAGVHTTGSAACRRARHVIGDRSMICGGCLAGTTAAAADALQHCMDAQASGACQRPKGQTVVSESAAQLRQPSDQSSCGGRHTPAAQRKSNDLMQETISEAWQDVLQGGAALHGTPCSRQTISAGCVAAADLVFHGPNVMCKSLVPWHRQQGQAFARTRS